MQFAAARTLYVLNFVRFITFSGNPTYLESGEFACILNIYAVAVFLFITVFI